MFNVQTINCMQYSEPVAIPANSIIKLGRNQCCQWNKTLTRNIEFKNTTICFNWKEAIWSLTKKKKQGDKKEKLTESLHLTVKIARSSNYNIDLRKLRVNKITSRRTTKRLWIKNLPTLRNDSSFAVQFSISISKTMAILLYTMKIIEMFELHASMPGVGKPRGVIPWISSDNPAKISYNYT